MEKIQHPGLIHIVTLRFIHGMKNSSVTMVVTAGHVFPVIFSRPLPILQAFQSVCNVHQCILTPNVTVSVKANVTLSLL